MVKADGLRSRGREFEPRTVYWMDVSDASYYIQENTKIKVAEWGTPKKYLISFEQIARI